MKKITLFLIVLVFLYSCNTGKYVSDYKQIKKTIDTLVILYPLVVIDALDYTGKAIADNELEDRVAIMLTNKANDILKAKYAVKKEMSYRKYTEEEIEKFVSLLSNLKNSKNPISKLKVPNSIYKDNKNKYYLFIYLKGRYISEDVHHPMNDRNSIYIAVGKTEKEEVGILLLNEKKEVLYFNSTFSINDPRIKDLVERDFMKVIKPIYYK